MIVSRKIFEHVHAFCFFRGSHQKDRTAGSGETLVWETSLAGGHL
jgi:hypothetical protein